MNKKEVYNNLIEYLFDDPYSFKGHIELHNEEDNTLERFVPKDEVIEAIAEFFREMKEIKGEED